MNSWVTFESEYHPGTSQLITIAAFATNPDFNFNTDDNDVGVIILAEPLLNVTLNQLPVENLLDEMKADGTLNDQTFINVGYGATAEFKEHHPLLPRDGVRRYYLSPYRSLTQNWLILFGNNDATSEDGKGTIPH